MSPPAMQTANVQTAKGSSTHLPLVVNRSTPVPKVPSEHHVLVRILAVALNPNDHKMVTHFNMPGIIADCGFSGIVAAEAGENNNNNNNNNNRASSAATARFPAGTRVCGAFFPYNLADPDSSSFAVCVVDARLLFKVPNSWNDLEAASLGVGLSTVSLALSDLNALSP